MFKRWLQFKQRLKGKLMFKDHVQTLIEKHHKQALASPYDYKVSILAIGAARDVIDAVDTTLDERDYAQQVILRLTQLRERYYDSEGEYTSGKGEIGSLLSDIVYDAEHKYHLI